jgi:hypothetical protein
MSEQSRPPLEESPEVAAAVDDDTTVSAFMTDGGPDEDSPQFREPGETGDAGGAAPAAAGVHDVPGQDPQDSPHRRPNLRTGAEQPWDPEDLAAAEGRDPTPPNVERAREELERDGPAAIERTVP